MRATRRAAAEMASEQPRFPFLQVDCEGGQAETLAAALMELGSSGWVTLVLQRGE